MTLTLGLIQTRNLTNGDQYLLKNQSHSDIDSWLLDCVWNMMAQTQKPDFVFRRNGRVHLNRRGASVQPTAGSRGVRISGSNAGYTVFRGGVKSTGYPLHSPVSPSLPVPCVTVCHQVSTGVYMNSMLSPDRRCEWQGALSTLYRLAAFSWVRDSGVPRGWFGVFKRPPPPKFRRYRWSPRSHEQEEPASRFPFALHCVLIRL